MTNTEQNIFEEKKMIKILTFVLLCVLTVMLLIISIYSIISFIDIIKALKDSELAVGEVDTSGLWSEMKGYCVAVTIFMLIIVVISSVFIGFFVAKKTKRNSTNLCLMLVSLLFFIMSIAILLLIEPENEIIASTSKTLFMSFIKFAFLINLFIVLIYLLSYLLFERDKSRVRVEEGELINSNDKITEASRETSKFISNKSNSSQRIEEK